MADRASTLVPKCDPCRTLVRGWEARLEVYEDCIKTENRPPAYPSLCSSCDPPAYHRDVRYDQQSPLYEQLRRGNAVTVLVKGLSEHYVPAQARLDRIVGRVYFTTHSCCEHCGDPQKLCWYRTEGCVRANDNIIYDIPCRFDDLTCQLCAGKRARAV